MRNKLNKRNDGFTIIEVMIVLAIAGLIMLIVFLAVPALQRNSRNTQRSNDASKIVAAVNECLSNNNGKLVGPCNTAANLGSYITIADNAQLDTIAFAAGNTPGSGATAPSINRAVLHTSAKCDANGTNVGGSGPSSRSFAVVYQVETNASPVNRCLGS